MSITSASDGGLQSSSVVVVGTPYSDDQANTSARETETLAAALELLMQLESISDLHEAGESVAYALGGHVTAQRAIVGWILKPGSHCAVIGDTLRGHNEQADNERRQAGSALEEIVIRGMPVCVSSDQSQRREPGLLAIARLIDSGMADNVIGCPLLDSEGNICGAWLVTDVPKQSSEHVVRTVDALSRPVGARLASIHHNRLSSVETAIRSARAIVARSRSATVIVGLLVTLGVILFPVTYNVRCDCVLEPVSRRYIAAPFDGSLEEAFVQPGDIVAKDALLAKMKARELDWELAGLRADYSRADKERKVSLAGGDFAETQIADLESQRIRHRTDLLEHRIANLELRSPFNGVIVSGDNKEVEGAPLKVGQTLFEIAPLGEMVVELLVPEEDYAYVAVDMPVRVRLHSFPSQRIEGTVQRIHPKAEIKENQNVFVAELKIDDPHGIYRPGMHGRAAVESVKRPLLWVLLHKPWASLMMWLGR